MERRSSSGSPSPGSGATGGCAWPTSSSRRAAGAPTWWRSSSPPWARGSPRPRASCSPRTPTASTSSCTAYPSSSPRRWPSTGTQGSGASWGSVATTPRTWMASSGSATGARGTPSATRPARTWPTGPRGCACSSRPASASSSPRRCSCIPSNPPTRSSCTIARRSTSVSEPAGPAVLFDMDGLLIDSEPLWLEAETAIMARLGASWSEQDQEQLLGGSLERSVRYLLSKATRPAPAELIGEWLMSDIIERVRRDGVPIQPGARELLAAVRRAGLPHALVTSSERGFMDAVLASTGMRFDVLVCAEDVTATKPDPEPYLLAAKLVGVDPGDCFALEDSPNGVASAEAAGCRVFAVPSLVPIPAAPGRTVVRSLLDLSADASGIRESGPRVNTG